MPLGGGDTEPMLTTRNKLQWWWPFSAERVAG